MMSLPLAQATNLVSNESESVDILQPLVIIDGVSMPVDQAVALLENLSYSTNSESDYLSIIEKYCDLILSCNNYISDDMLY